MEDNLQEWTEKVAALRQRYTWLLFFSVPKLLQLHSLTHSPGNSLTDQPVVDLDAIVHNICFLFENDILVRRRLKPVVQVKILKQVSLIGFISSLASSSILSDQFRRERRLSNACFGTFSSDCVRVS